MLRIHLNFSGIVIIPKEQPVMILLSVLCLSFFISTAWLAFSYHPALVTIDRESMRKLLVDLRCHISHEADADLTFEAKLIGESEFMAYTSRDRQISLNVCYRRSLAMVAFWVKANQIGVPDPSMPDQISDILKKYKPASQSRL